MNSCRTVPVLVVVFSLLSVSHCSGIGVAKTACKCTGKVVKYGLPVAVVAVIAYTIYNHFFPMRAIDRGVRRANLRIDEVKNDTTQLKKDITKANETLITVQEGVVRIEEDAGQIKISIELSKKELLERIEKGELKLSDLIMQLEGRIKKKITEEIRHSSEQMDSFKEDQKKLREEEIKEMAFLRSELAVIRDENRQQFASLERLLKTCLLKKSKKIVFDVKD